MTFKQFFAAAVFCTGLLAASVSASGIEAIYTEDTDIETAFDLELVPEPAALFSVRSTPTYHSDYGYTTFANTENGEAKQALYKQLDTAAALFHNDYTLDAAAENNVVTELNFADAGLNLEEAMSVWNIYKHDHPLYYWISNTILYSNTSIYLLTDDLYDEGAEREACNALIDEKIAEYLAITEGETSSYRIAMAYHDAIIDAIDYAYKANGVTPEDALWAHNIMGVFTEQGGVCESYARTFQLLLNLSGVENIFVTGRGGGEDHAWNLVQLDDGEWYWCDLTWDDSPDWMWGVKYNYFCVNDTENLNWSDGDWESTEVVNFMNQHTPNTPSEASFYYLYPLPARAEDAYAATGSELLLRDIFTEGQFTYAVAGYNAVQIVEVNCTETDLVIPETAENNGIVYNVISIGSTDSDGRFGTSDFKWQGVPPETITISKNLKFIWDFAFQLSSVREFLVNENNPYFTSDNGVLFTKSKYTLIRYPDAYTATEYTIPPETKIIAHQAFYSCVYLEELTIGAGVNTIDSPNWGKGYLDSKPSDMSFANTISGGFDRIYQALTGDKTINIHEDNSTYSKINGIIYILHDDETVSLLFASKNIKEANLPDNVILIEGLAFRDCISLTQIVLPAKIVELRSYAFANCVKLTDVYFMGDIPEIWRTDIFFGTSPALTLHYSVNSKSDWTSPTWLAPDGLTYNTQPYTPETPPEAEDTVIYGDADGNGIFDDSDILLLNQYFAGHNVSIDMTAADIDDDNQVTRRDAMYLARALAGWPGYILPQVGN